MAGCFGTHPEDVARERELHRYLDAQHGDDDARSDAADLLIYDEDARRKFFNDLFSDGEFDDVLLMALRMYGSSKSQRMERDQTELGKCLAQVVYRAEEAHIEAAAQKPTRDLFDSIGLVMPKFPEVRG